MNVRLVVRWVGSVYNACRAEVGRDDSGGDAVMHWRGIAHGGMTVYSMAYNLEKAGWCSSSWA